mmetsp:Transcript_21480/g.29859  ORF Transcript_21480/g.29859 Transcript_21480/m.29859 type:complete len:212 (-) Transcript_21480:148-783(-)
MNSFLNNVCNSKRLLRTFERKLHAQRFSSTETTSETTRSKPSERKRRPKAQHPKGTTILKATFACNDSDKDDPQRRATLGAIFASSLIFGSSLPFSAISLADPGGGSFSIWASGSEENFSNIPQGLVASDTDRPQALSKLVDPKSEKLFKQCASPCLASCVRGGSGAPELGPFSVRKDPVVFKEGFRSRSYCLTECTNLCASLTNEASRNK